MKAFTRLHTLALAVMALTGGSAQAALDLNGIGFVQYGDAQSYSLPIANLQVGEPNNPGSTYFIQSGGGQINDLTVVGTGSGGTPIINNFDGMDNSYETPSGVSGATFWTPDPATYRGTQGTVNNNGDFTWDTNLLALKTYLAGDAMVFFFNNNQENSLGAAAQTLAAWAQVTVTDGAGNVIGIYDFTNDNSPYNLVTAGGGGTFLGDVTTYTSDGSGPDGNSNANTDYVVSGGEICVDTSGPIPVPVPCGSPGASAPINHNLGSDQAAYAILFPELNAQLTGLFGSLADGALAGYTLHVDVRLGCDPALFGTDPDAEICSGEVLGLGKNLNNGFEQIFINTAVQPTVVPEPGTLALAGLALLGAGLARRRTRR